MSAPNLRALQQGDADAWNEAFDWLWPTAFAVAQVKLQPFLPEDIEDAAIESLEELVEKVRELEEVEDLKPLTACIAHRRAVSRLREHFAAKRGAGRTQSLDGLPQDDATGVQVSTDPTPVAEVEQAELAGVLQEVLTRLKPEQRAILTDFYLYGLTYEQISQRHGIPQGTIGVYLKRGLEIIRRATERHPKLLKELTAFLRCLV
jgi:RNA polymerase sigma-70 factor, ECF subfamily